MFLTRVLLAQSPRRPISRRSTRALHEAVPALSCRTRPIKQPSGRAVWACWDTVSARVLRLLLLALICTAIVCADSRVSSCRSPCQPPAAAGHAPTLRMTVSSRQDPTAEAMPDVPFPKLIQDPVLQRRTDLRNSKRPSNPIRLALHPIDQTVRSARRTRPGFVCRP